MSQPPHGRFAPTPSGRMHLGNVWCALVAWLAVRAEHGTLTLRIEDLDPRKTPAGATEALVDDLRWLGLDWDEGPVFQSERASIYEGYALQLERMGLTYPCFCSRAELHAAQAPHASDGTPIYAGTCRDLTAAQVAERAKERPAALRLRVPEVGDPAGVISFVDEVYGHRSECLARECGDFLVRRSDHVHAYQLAVTVDDALMGVDYVVRGRDLLGSCARQIYLQRLLGFETPRYAHLPMLMAPDGTRRLSKRERDCDLGFMRSHFEAPEALIGRLAHLTGLVDTPEPLSARELLGVFSWERLRATALKGDISVPGSFFC